MKKVYVGLSADILHDGHINILKIANTYGDVTVGLLTDKAIATYKNIPYLDFKRRKVIIQNIKYVKNSDEKCKPFMTTNTHLNILKIALHALAASASSLALHCKFQKYFLNV